MLHLARVAAHAKIVSRLVLDLHAEAGFRCSFFQCLPAWQLVVQFWFSFVAVLCSCNQNVIRAFCVVWQIKVAFTSDSSQSQ